MTGRRGRWRRWPLGGRARRPRRSAPVPTTTPPTIYRSPSSSPPPTPRTFEGDAVPGTGFPLPGRRRPVARSRTEGRAGRPPGARLSGEGPRLVAATARSSNPAVVNATYGDTLTVFAEFDEPLRDLPVVHIAGVCGAVRCDPSPRNRGRGRKLGRGGGDDERSQNKILGVGHTTKTHVRRREGRRAQPDHIGVHRTLGRCPGTRGDSRHRRQRRRARVVGVLRRRRLRRRSVSSNGRHAGRDERQNVAAAAARPVKATSERRARAHPTWTKRYRRYFPFYTASRKTNVAATPGDN